MPVNWFSNEQIAEMVKNLEKKERSVVELKELRDYLAGYKFFYNLPDKIEQNDFNHLVKSIEYKVFKHGD